MTTIVTTIDIPKNPTERIVNTADADTVHPGDWYWLKLDEDDRKRFEADELLCCVFNIGSNYAQLKYPNTDRNYWEWRVHFSQWGDVCRLERSPQTWFDQWADQEKREIRRINGEIQDLCARLGIDPTKKHLTESKSSLSLVSRAVDTTEYKTALIKAKDNDLPSLFKQIKEHSEEMSRWLLASSLSMRAKCGDMEESVGHINDRIFTVNIYAGLSESVDLVRQGDPAARDEKLRIMQGKLFMDEECLLNYSHGGMEFKDIGDFDQWLSRPDNLYRILPFAKCMVAFQVRRYDKERENNGSLSTAWINFELSQMDKITFLYIRNGDRLYRLNTEIDFGDELFADRDEFDLTGPMMVNNKSHDHPTVTVRDFEERVKTHKAAIRDYKKRQKKYDEQHRLFNQWRKKHPKEDESKSGLEYEFRQPWGPDRPSRFNPDDWTPLDDRCVYLDDVNDRIRKQANFYNRISALIQGLLDRSDVLHPHPPVKLWTPQGFETFIELICDHDRTLYDGAEPPSWESYKAHCNASLGVGSVVTGQDAFYWASLPKEPSSRNSNYLHTPYRYTEGNPGPGKIAIVPEWSSRSKKATFRWIQTRYIFRSSRWEQSGNRDYKRSISVPAESLFNISGYQLGDFKQFFNDPRTRRTYLQWAHLLLTAEEYHAGNLDVATFKRKDRE